MKKAIYPGSFDPITRGHLDIIERASHVFDEVIVVIMRNKDKQYTFSEEERLQMINVCCRELTNVKYDASDGLSVHYARKHNANVMIRGIRAVLDYEFELQIATANMWIDEGVETCFLLSKPKYSFISSSTIKEMAYYQQDVSQFVTPFVAEKLKAKYEESK